MNKNNIYKVIATCRWMMTFALVFSFAACTDADDIAPAVTDDALAALPANTSVGIFAELKEESGESRVSRAVSDITTTTDNVNFTMHLPGGTSETQLTGTGTIGNLPFSRMLKDFNLVEGNDRCVSRWTVLEASNTGSETLTGVARLTADADGLPTLNYTLKHTGAKVTVILNDGTTPFSTIDGINATLTVQNSKGVWMYNDQDLLTYLGGVKALASDPAADDANMKLAIVADNTPFMPIEMAVANNQFTTVVPATPDIAPLTEYDKLVIIVTEDPDANGPLTTGTYSLQLKDIVLLDENGSAIIEDGVKKNFTSLKAGEHYTLNVTLNHNMLVQATATIGWNEASADANLGYDDTKFPPYEYISSTNTYNIYQLDGIEDAMAHRAANHPNAAIASYINSYSIAYDAQSLRAWGEKATAAIANQTTHPNLIVVADIDLDPENSITENDGIPSSSNWEPIGTSGKRYNGTIDGRNHTISNLRINNTAGYCGFVGGLGDGGKLMNLTISDGMIYSTGEYVGMFVGISEGLVKNCRVTGTSLIKGRKSVGGILGANYGLVDNCHTEQNMNITSIDKVAGGITGNNGSQSFPALIMGCTNAATVSGGNPSGNIVASNSFSYVVACANLNSAVNNNPSSTGSVYGYTYGCWSTANNDFGKNYGPDNKRIACYLFTGNGSTITPVDNSVSVVNIDDAIRKMNAAIDTYNNSVAEDEKCPYRWAEGASETANPVLTTVSNQ